MSEIAIAVRLEADADAAELEGDAFLADALTLSKGDAGAIGGDC